jgi:hypothetical protein
VDVDAEPVEEPVVADGENASVGERAAAADRIGVNGARGVGNVGFARVRDIEDGFVGRER